jgi:hypothetical protein
MNLKSKTPRFVWLICVAIRGALGRTRTCDLLIRSHSPSGKRRDTGDQGETKPRCYRVLAHLEGQGGTGRDTRLRSDCGQNLGTIDHAIEHYRGLR